MFGASVSELYLLIKSLFNIGRAVDLCVITKKIRGGGIDRYSTLAIFFYMRYR